MTEVFLMRRGVSVGHLQCDCCGQYVRSLSPVGWCAHCEWLCTEIGRRVRAKLSGDAVGFDANGSEAAEYPS